MNVLDNLIAEITPLYLISAIGFLAGKLLKIEGKSIATLTIYVISPIVFLLSIAQAQFTLHALLAPAITFTLATILAPTVLYLTKFYLGDKTPYLTALATGTSNWGYFGLPIAFVLFDATGVAAYILLGFGFQIFENTLGVYFISRGHKSPAESFKNIFKLPVIYAIFIGLILSFLKVEMPTPVLKFFTLFKGAYTVMGMMMIGLGLASLTRFRSDIKFDTTMCALRFIIWPAIAVGFVTLNSNIHLLDTTYEKAFLLFAIMPMAANNIAFAAQFNMNEGKAAMAVLITTLIALFYIPWAIHFLGILT